MKLLPVKVELTL